MKRKFIQRFNSIKVFFCLLAFIIATIYLFLDLFLFKSNNFMIWCSFVAVILGIFAEGNIRSKKYNPNNENKIGIESQVIEMLQNNTSNILGVFKKAFQDNP